MAVLHDLCSQLQNASRARVAQTAVRPSHQTVLVLQQLVEHGFIRSFQRGNLQEPDTVFVPTTPSNISSRRIWVNLKYKGTVPILRKCQAISTPSMKIDWDFEQLSSFIEGTPDKALSLLQMGELLLVENPKLGIVDAITALQYQQGGRLLLRAST